MTTNNAWLSDSVRLCGQSRMYIQLLQNSIFAKIDAQTTDAQFVSAAQNMLALCERLEAKVDLFHYGALTGTHQCIRDVYEIASAYLANLRIWASEPSEPSEPPAPNPQPLSDADLMAYVERWIGESAKGTFFGTDQDGDSTG
jgi:hypothetical protein